MKLDRRSFLAMGIGGTAGTMLTPLPWKVTDDLSIWSQNWPWVPVPTEDAAARHDTVCTLCPGGCGLTVRKIGTRVVKIDGREGTPVNDGGACLLGISGTQLLYGPSRVKTPLKKVKDKKTGKTKWKKISVSDAIAEITEKLSRLRDERKSHELACICGSNSGTGSKLFERFLEAYGSPNFFRTPSMFDSCGAMFSEMCGKRARAGFDLKNSDFVLSFGSGLLDGWGSPVNTFQAVAALRDNKGKIIQIEPRLSNTAAKADRWIPVKPGGEGVLALGIAGLLIEKGGYDAGFVRTSTTGFDEFKRLVADKFSPQNVADMTGVKVEDMESLAKGFSEASAPLAVFGRGDGGRPGSMAEFMAVNSLNILKGRINREGGLWTMPEPVYGKWRMPVMDLAAKVGVEQPILGGAAPGESSGGLLNRLPGVINDSRDETPISVLFVTGANPAYTMTDSASVKKALEKIPFIVSFSPYMDETASLADIILPNHVFLERTEDVMVTAGLREPVIGLCKPVTEPLYGTVDSGDAIISIAGEFGGGVAESFPWKNFEECLKDVLADQWEALESEGFQVIKSSAESTGAFNLGLTDILSEPYAAVQGKKQSFPLVLVPYDTMRISDGFIGNPPFATKTVSDKMLKDNLSVVEINPVDAKQCGLSEGDTATLFTPSGEKEVRAGVRVHLCEGIMPGVIALPRGLGHTAYDEFLADKGVNVNELIGSLEDKSGLDVAWGIRARLA